MKYTIEDSFENFKPWSGAVDAFERIISEGKADEADRFFEENEPAEGWTDTAINDFLWFDADTVFEALGMKPTDTETHDADEIGAAWQEENERFNYKLVRLEFVDADELRAYYVDEDDETRAEEVETLTAEEVAELFGKSSGEIDAGAQSVEVWG